VLKKLPLNITNNCNNIYYSRAFLILQNRKGSLGIRNQKLLRFTVLKIWLQSKAVYLC